MECSSKEMTGVEEIFHNAINVVVANDKSNQKDPEKPLPGFPAQPNTAVKKKKQRKCAFL
jgi:Ras family protein A